ncbi:MAG: signal peptidase [Aeromicrobium sp.]|nr:signal peptidase [Aeromicrobium sp.]
MTLTQPRHREETKPAGRRLLLFAVVLLAVLASVATTGSSSASYVSSTSSTGTVTAAADWTPPAVAVTAPPAALKGTATITATASDTDSGIGTVTIQRADAGATSWTTLCTTTTSPYACSWATGSVDDGAYDLRAIAVDKAGNTATSATVRATVANALVVVLTPPADVIRGTVILTTTVSNAGSLAPSVRVEYAPAGTTSWSTICTVAAAPYTCSVPTTAGPNGTYDIRSVAVAGTTTYISAVVRDITVDNLAPTVTMTDPGTPLRGTKTFAATAGDAHSGVARVVIQSATGTAWTELCTVTSAPYSCLVDTGTLANGTYSFRAVATDVAGNTATSTAVTNRAVQNTVSTVTLTTPAAHLRGTVGLAATVTTNGTVASVAFQRSVAGAATWTPVCADTASPYTCSFATTGVADGTYDLRAVVTDSNGRTTASPVVANRVVDNTAGRGVDIQTTNGGTAGRIDTGDTMVFTFSEQMDLSTIYSVWSATASSGAATSGTVEVSTGDVVDVTRPFGADLGTVSLNADFVGRTTSSVHVVMSAATVVQDGVSRTVVTLRFTGSTGNQVSEPATMSWTPAATIRDLAGNAIGTAAVAESGSPDLDF